MRIFALLAAACLTLPTLAAAEEKYVGYYYPEITSEETFARVITPGPTPTPEVRADFVTSITKAQLAAPESPRFVIFEKGDASEHLVIVALDDDVFSTLYRARALMAQLTSNFRGTEFFRTQGLAAAGTFYDMIQLLQFETLVISDGETWSHQVNFVPEG